MLRPFFLATALFFAAGRIAVAQPATEGAPKAPNPPHIGRGPQTPEEKAEADRQMEEIFRKAREEGDAMRKLPPAQQQEALRKIKEEIVRGTLTRAGFTAKKLQDRIMAFIAEQEKSRHKVRETANKVYLALEPQGDPTNAQGMSLLLINYLNADEDAKDQRELANRAMDKEITFTAQPHLMALLTLNGIIGEASWFTSDVIMTGSQSIGSLAEFR
ncbi:MAG: hypothetical protein KY445_11910 [Armatimonadetes bacterium]|nr:hypothetical protein [Armatimonadota bacterium]